MDNLTNKEPGIKDSTVLDSASKEQKKKESRPVIGAKAQTILEFLRACSPYEADSFRVMVGYGMGKVTSTRLRLPTCWRQPLPQPRAHPGERDKQRGRDETPSGARAKTDGSGQGICGHRPALPYQCRADKNLVRLQGGGGSTAAPAIPTRHERREKLKSNRNGIADETARDKENSIHGILPKPLQAIPPFRSLISAK